MINWCAIHGAYEGAACLECEPESPTGSDTVVIGGLDLAKLHDYSAMVDAEVTFHSCKVRGVKTWPHVDYTVVVEDVANRYQKTRMRSLAFDESGVGEPIKELLFAKGVKADGIKFGEFVDYVNPWGEHERAPVKYAMVEYGRFCMQAGYVDLPSKGKNAQELIMQLGEQEIVPSVADRVKYAHPEGRHDDLAWAFLMMLYESRNWLTGNSLYLEATKTPDTRFRPYYGAWEGRTR